MSYLNKAERKSQIMKFAKEIVLNEGLNTLTVRHLANTASISTGQIHHHFRSISELKAEVFLELVRFNLDLTQVKRELKCDELLIYVLGFEESAEEQSYLKLWNDAENSIDTDLVLKKAYQEAIQLWHQTIIEVLELGRADGTYQFDLNEIQDIAWRLIAISFGLETLYNLDIAGIGTDFFYKHLKVIIQHEIQG
ncbi:TetR family transcriptional regulator [Acinetobacter sp. P8-3-8]|uniref:TetR family transcriptional regulator n=1 Tax=Acinetobacter sp. P8-3-8 TaxID=1029823 RepID=UPI00024869F0|nr:TetR family transcriptional regulator [Acinetobacter sp. P8-3-8]